DVPDDRARTRQRPPAHSPDDLRGGADRAGGCGVTRRVVGTFGGPGGWAEACRALGLTDLGIELDPSACATRAAAGHLALRADVSRFDVSRLAGTTEGQTHSAPCVVFSAAGNQAGNAVTAILAEGIRDAFAGRKTRALRRREMARALRCSTWGGDQPWKPPPAPGTRKHREWQARWKARLLARKGRPAVLRRAMTSATAGTHPPRAQRSARIWAAVRSASLVIEPARFIEAGRPERTALEQVPSVLPLWQVYAAELRRMGYSAWTGILDSACYGVPQTPERAILVASRVREVARPEPTHYDPRKGLQLWGTPWMSMAEALGMGATARPAPTVTAGGTATGGAEPFGHRDRDALEAERDAGRWALRVDAQRNATVRSASAPAPALKFGHSAAEMQWVLHRNRGSSCDDDRRDHPGSEPEPTITSAGGKASANMRKNCRMNNTTSRANGQWTSPRGRCSSASDPTGRRGQSNGPRPPSRATQPWVALDTKTAIKASLSSPSTLSASPSRKPPRSSRCRPGIHGRGRRQRSSDRLATFSRPSRP